jgi:hypothetical protein
MGRGVNRTDPSQGWDRWRAVVNAVMNLLEYQEPLSFSERTLLNGGRLVVTNEHGVMSQSTVMLKFCNEGSLDGNARSCQRYL